MGNSERQIIRSLCYSDIFEYPLTKEELWRFLIKNSPDEQVDKACFEKSLQKLSQSVAYYEKRFYCFRTRAHIISKRIKKHFYSKKKLFLATKIATFCQWIPSIVLLGVSGGLAMNNADDKDDIDFFIITKKHSIWITRLLLLFVLSYTRNRRSFKAIDTKDKICLNMFIDENSLQLPKDRQDLYTAHEIVQLKVLFERKNTYRRFLESNKWVLDYLPNAFLDKKKYIQFYSETNQYGYLVYFLNKLAQAIQMIPINRRKTTETITDHLVAFHPNDYRNKIRIDYNKRLKRYV